MKTEFKFPSWLSVYVRCRVSGLTQLIYKLKFNMPIQQTIEIRTMITQDYSKVVFAVLDDSGLDGKSYRYFEYSDVGYKKACEQVVYLYNEFVKCVTNPVESGIEEIK